jgi:hypothetical protein
MGREFRSQRFDDRLATNSCHGQNTGRRGRQQKDANHLDEACASKRLDPVSSEGVSVKRSISGAVAVLTLTVPVVVHAGPRDLAAIDAECQGAMRQSAAACSCVVGRASSELNDVQERYVAAAFTDDQPTMTALQTAMSEAEIGGIGRFMSAALSACGVTQ